MTTKATTTTTKKKSIRFYESSNQIYLSDLIGLQRTQRTQVEFTFLINISLSLSLSLFSPERYFLIEFRSENNIDRYISIYSNERVIVRWFITIDDMIIYFTKEIWLFYVDIDIVHFMMTNKIVALIDVINRKKQSTIVCVCVSSSSSFSQSLLSNRQDSIIDSLRPP